jgi:hypothetical protein
MIWTDERFRKNLVNIASEDGVPCNPRRFSGVLLGRVWQPRRNRFLRDGNRFFLGNRFLRDYGMFGCTKTGFIKPVFPRKNRFYKNQLGPGFSTQKPVFGLGHVICLDISLQPTDVMGVKSEPTKDRAVWDNDRDAYLVGLLQEQARLGKRADSGFKKEAWTAVMMKYNEKFAVQYDRDQLKARLKQVNHPLVLYFQILGTKQILAESIIHHFPTAKRKFWLGLGSCPKYSHCRRWRLGRLCEGMAFYCACRTPS